MTTAHRPSSPAMEAFYARLEPELSAQDLDTRAANAAGIVLKAIAEGNEDLTSRAFARMVERWAQREDRLPAPAWMWDQRHQTVGDILNQCPDEWPVLEAAWTAWYTTMARAGGQDRETSDAYAYERVQNWKALRGVR